MLATHPESSYQATWHAFSFDRRGQALDSAQSSMFETPVKPEKVLVRPGGGLKQEELPPDFATLIAKPAQAFCICGGRHFSFLY